MNDWLEKIKWDSDGLVTVVAQDQQTHEVLMIAWMNKESLVMTVESKQAVYWSRSRQRLWKKGEESGHTQTVKDIRLDCDGDVILMQVVQKGGIACHTGRKHCFFRQLEAGQWQEVDAVVKDPSKIYHKKGKG